MEQFQNKSSAAYYSSPTFHDSGSTPTSFFRDCPENFIESKGIVKTADSSSIPTTGYGTVKFGDMKLNGVIYVPSFTHNLLPVIQIMKQGYKQVIHDKRLEIYDGDRLIATGEYDEKHGLIKMHESINQCNQVSTGLSLMEWHSKLGHISESLLRRTLKMRDISFTGQMQKCDTCLESKLKRKKIKKMSNSETNILEVIEADPMSYSLESYDGNKHHLKLVDNSSGYIYQELLPELKSATLLKCFRKFQARMERVTGNRVLNFRSDDDTAFRGCFFDYLQSSGIIKNSGQPYRKHVPPICELAHQTKEKPHY